MTVTWTEFRHARRRSRQAWVLLAAAGLGLLGGLVWFFTAGQFAVAEPQTPGPSEAPVLAGGWMYAVDPVRAVPEGRAAGVLDTLAVKGRSAKDNYDRGAFGQAWLDVDRNGCDTRNDILRRDLAAAEFVSGSRCQVAGGTFQEPYTGRMIAFRRGAETSAAVQIDHVVALGDAWQKGAQQLTAQQREHLANDPLNLIAVDGPANQDKSASDAATWLPPNKAFRCHYVARQISVKAAYRLWVTPAEKEAMKRILDLVPRAADDRSAVRTRRRFRAGGPLLPFCCPARMGAGTNLAPEYWNGSHGTSHGRFWQGARRSKAGHRKGSARRRARLDVGIYEAELLRLQAELVALQEWVRSTGARVLVIFEGRDAAGKGSAIKRVTEYLNPRFARIVALPAPTERERGEWYFQRYVPHLPAAGEIVLMDRSWYNRAGVEHVMGFCTPAEHKRFMAQCPVFERLLIQDGILLFKYWFSISHAEQERRFKSRLDDPMRQWKLSPMDREAILRWEDYSRAKDDMFMQTDTAESPWYVVEAEDKRRARINLIAHLLASIDYSEVRTEPVTLPERPKAVNYTRPPRELFRYVPDFAASLEKPAED